jgi:hypothetical protein
MRKDQGRRLAGVRRRTLIAAVALLTPLTVLGAASPALAKTPKGIFSVFQECPLGDPGLVLCTVSNTTSGEVKLGNTTVPIKMQTITLQGGAALTPNPDEAEYFLLPAENPANSMSKTELNVPGGLTDFINCEEIKGEFFFEKEARKACKEFFEGKALGVTATTELAATETNPAILNELNFEIEKGTALTLPVKVHLKNPLLGNSCYIGSEAHPLQLELTTGTTSPPKGFKSLTGSAGIPETVKEKGHALLRVSGLSLVGNTFTSPGAEGCGEFLFIKGYLDSLVNAKLGIPNTAGNNQAVLKGEIKEANPEEVIASEKF